jgi:adenylate kinase family enzyme
MHVLCLMGPPGVGKDTQMQILSRAFPATPQLSVGKLIREFCLEGWLSPEQCRQVASGLFLSDDVFMDLFLNAFAEMARKCQADGRELVLIEGMPRTEDQIEWLNSNACGWQLLLLDAPDIEVTRRMERRLVCGERRADDQAGVFSSRLENYRRAVEPMLHALPNRLSINATADPCSVAQLIFGYMTVMGAGRPCTLE